MLKTIIFAKAPQPGLAKTRLIPALGHKGAAELARHMLNRTLASAITAKLGPVELCVTPAQEHSAWQNIPIPDGVEISNQVEGDLGRRMAQAAQRAIEQGQTVLLIGTDCVEMSPTLLVQAAAQLHAYDAVIHPSTDGGYVLLGLQQFHPSLFTYIAWSTNRVSSVTIQRIEQLGWSLHQGDRLHDVDEPQDLTQLTSAWFPVDDR